MRRTLPASFTLLALSLGLASSASALSLTIDPGHDRSIAPAFGSTITVTVTLDTTGAPAAGFAFVELGWDPDVLLALNATLVFTLGTSSQVITSGLNVGASNLTSQNGTIPWLGPAISSCDLAGPTAGNQCITINQAQTAVGPFTPLVPDPATLVSTLQFEVVGFGLTGLDVVEIDAFGATPVFVPEPTTAALLGLGFAGLAAARRRA